MWTFGTYGSPTKMQASWMQGQDSLGSYYNLIIIALGLQ